MSRQTTKHALYRTLVFAIACIVFIPAPVQAQLTEGSVRLNGSTTVPFKLSGNHIYVQAIVDGRPFAFLFDSGAAASLSVEAQNALALTVTGYVDATGGGAAVTKIGIVTVPQFTVGSMTYSKGSFVYLPPLALQSPFPDLPFGGIFGREVFRKLVVTIDYQKSQLTFSQPSSFSPPPGAQLLPLTLRDNYIPSVTASINGHTGSFDVDSGSGLALIVTKQFALSTGLEHEFPKVVSMQVGRGIGGPIMGEAGRGRVFALGPYQFENLPVSVTSSGVFASSDLAGNIGVDILRRFTVSLDIPDSKLFLIPNANFSAPFSTNRSGLFVIPDGSQWKVDSVVPGSPAAQAGVQDGDTLLTADGQSASALAADGLRAIWNGPPGSDVHLQLRRGTKTIAVDFVLRDLF
ncbi:MAG TPA: aspartyl protease family protein [Candidatus Rubrimentiphilum sp.]|nr:aspartyl protease family protein [Candidatus Rubrimentiphilum sp.]